MVNGLLPARLLIVEQSLTEFLALSAHDAWSSLVSRQLPRPRRFLLAVAGCSHYMLAEREPWRHEAELTCLNSGAVNNNTAGRVRIAAIEGPGACGIDYPLRVSALGESGPLSYDDEPVPPGSIPNSSTPRTAMPQNWPGASPAIQSNPLPPVQAWGDPYPLLQSYPATQVYPPPQSYPAPQPAAQIGCPPSAQAAGNARRRREHPGRPAASLLRRTQRAELFAGSVSAAFDALTGGAATTGVTDPAARPPRAGDRRL